MCVCVCVCVQGWEGNLPIDKRQAKNTIHYHPLRAISFPTALLSETILFIDGKINHLKAEGAAETNEINESSARGAQITDIR